MRCAAATAFALALAAAGLSAQTATPATPRTADGKVDLNGIWGAAVLPPPVNPNDSIKFLFPVPGVHLLGVFPPEWDETDADRVEEPAFVEAIGNASHGIHVGGEFD